MLKQLEIMEAGKDFVEAIWAIYRQQKAKIRINGKLAQIEKYKKEQDKDVYYLFYCLYYSFKRYYK